MIVNKTQIPNDTNLSDLIDPQQLPIVRTIIQAVKSICYGSVEIIIHNGQIVQIESKEKIRFDQRPKKTI